MRLLCLFVHSGDNASRRRTDSVAARAGRRLLEPLGALVAEEVVPAEDVVDLEAFRARVALADVALEQRLVDDHARPLPVAEEGLGRGTPAGLAVGGHRRRERLLHPARPGNSAREGDV